MNAKAFFVDALTSALDLGLASPDDVLRQVTPEVLAEHLPRPLWARLLTACVGAPKVDAQLVVDTLGVSNLCEHVPPALIWACLAEIGARVLGGELGAVTPRPAATASSAPTATPAAPPTPLSINSPPEPEPAKPAPSAPAAAVGPSIPKPGAASALSDLVAEMEAEDQASSQAPARSRTPTSQRLRANSRFGNRRPQAAAPAPEPEPPSDNGLRRPRRAETEVEVEVETAPAGRDDWRSSLAVEDEQLVEWSGSEETQTAAAEEPAFDRKR